MHTSISRTPRIASVALAAGVAVVLVGSTASVPSAVAAPVDDPATAVIASYDFDTPITGGVITDASGNGLSATLRNADDAPTTPGAEDGSTALDLPGGASNANAPYVELPRSILEGRTDITVSTTVDWNGSGDWQWIWALGTDASRYLFSTPQSGDGTVRAAITTSGGGGEAVVSGSQPLASDWSTVTVTLDTDADLLTAYLDGVAIGSTTTTVSAGELMTDAATSSGAIGRSFYGDPYFEGAIDELTVWGAALTAEQVAALVDEVPEVTGVAETDVALRTAVGVAPALPGTVTASYSDGVDRPVAVEWDAVDPASYAQPGTFTVNGVAAGTTITATVTVYLPGEITVDLGSNTGAFYGGASGTLYGVYGEGLPSSNLIEGIDLRTVSTKAQDGPQHPGADALEVVGPLADASDGDVYIYMTDIHRGFPYEWPGDTPEEKFDTYLEKIETQVEQVTQLSADYQDNIVFVPFNEPEGNMFGTGQWSYDGTSWLDDPTDYFAAWDEVYATITGIMPEARIAGPNTSVLFEEVYGFLEHVIAEDTVPDVMTWHELSDPAKVRDSVRVYRGWEEELFAGTAYEPLPININEYAFNYHTSVPGQMIQWISAIEESKVDADIAYWNIDGNLSDSAVQSNRGNGQWWLLNAYSRMSGHTLSVTPPQPDESYTLQGVASLDEEKQQSRLIFGGESGSASIRYDNVPDAFGSAVHASVTEIPWTGQLGDSPQPRSVAEVEVDVVDGTVALDFGDALPAIEEGSAYQVILSPGESAVPTAVPPTSWSATYEAEDAAYTGSGYTRNGPEGSPADVSKFYTSGGFDVGGLRTGSDLTLEIPVSVPADGRYDLSIFSSSLNTYEAVQEQGPTNVFVRVDGGAEQEVFLTMGYKWVVWDHADTAVDLTAGDHTISLSARSSDGVRGTVGDVILDRIDLSLPNPGAAAAVYEAEYATLDGADVVYSSATRSGPGAVSVPSDGSATFWVYSSEDAESLVTLDGVDGEAGLSVNEVDVPLGAGNRVNAFLSGGVNKLTVSGAATIDRLVVEAGGNALPVGVYEAEDASLSGTAQVTELSLASGQCAVTDVGGEPGNGNEITFGDVEVESAGDYALTFRYSNEEQSPASHYNPDPVARHADVDINGDTTRVWFPHSFHENNFWELTVPVTLDAGTNTIGIHSEELPNFDGETYIEETFPGILLRSQLAPNLDWISVTPLAAAAVVAPEDAALVITPDTVAAGETLTVDGSGFAAGEDVSLAWGDADPLSVAAGGDGRFSIAITVPPGTPAGTYALAATGSTSGASATASFTVTSSATPPPSDGGPAGPGSGTGQHGGVGDGLASTGADAFPFLAIALLLIGLGTALVRARRIRRHG